MKGTFPEELKLCEAQAGSILALGQIQNTLMAGSLAAQNNVHNLEAIQWRAVLSQQSMAIIQLQAMFNRRTQFMSPTQGFHPNVYKTRKSRKCICTPFYPQLSNVTLLGTENVNIQLSAASVPPSSQPPWTPSPSEQVTAIKVWDTDGIYTTPSTGLRAYVSNSPTSTQEPRPQTQVDLVLPPVEAFARPGSLRPLLGSSFSEPHTWSSLGELLFFPPSLGCQGIMWIQILEKVRQPKFLWSVYKPAKSLDNYGTVEALWTLFTLGEPLLDADGVRTGMKPPLFILEEMFTGGKWRSGIDSTVSTI